MDWAALQPLASDAATLVGIFGACLAGWGIFREITPGTREDDL